MVRLQSRRGQCLARHRPARKRRDRLCLSSRSRPSPKPMPPPCWTRFGRMRPVAMPSAPRWSRWQNASKAKRPDRPADGCHQGQLLHHGQRRGLMADLAPDLASGLCRCRAGPQAVFRACMNARTARRAAAAGRRAYPSRPADTGTGSSCPGACRSRGAALARAKLRAEPAVRLYRLPHRRPLRRRAGGSRLRAASDAASCPEFRSFGLGSDEYPDRSTTLLISVEKLRQAKISSLSARASRTGSASLSHRSLPA